MDRARERRERRIRRHRRIRKHVSGGPDTPRLCVSRSLRHVYAQIIDDIGHCTLIGVSGCSPAVREIVGDDKSKTAESQAVGKLIAQKAREKGIERVNFDRGGHLYHGRIRAIADGAREGGLEF